MKPGQPHQKIAEDAGMESFAVLDEVRQSDGPKHTSVIRSDMQKVMQSDAAVFRTQSVRFRSLRLAGGVVESPLSVDLWKQEKCEKLTIRVP